MPILSEWKRRSRHKERLFRLLVDRSQLTCEQMCSELRLTHKQILRALRDLFDEGLIEPRLDPGDIDRLECNAVPWGTPNAYSRQIKEHRRALGARVLDQADLKA